MGFLPDYFFKRITDIPLSFLKGLGISALIMDIDNTLTFDCHDALPEDVECWLRDVADSGIRGMLLSNNSDKRVEPFAAKCRLPYIALAKKPTRESVPAVFELLQTDSAETAMIGDQFFTDILFGKRAGCGTIIVEKMGEDIPRFIKFKRFLETPVRWMLRIRGYTKP